MNNNSDNIHIALSATGNYAVFVTTIVLSIVENTKEQIQFHVLTENFSIQDELIVSDFFKKYENISFEFISVEKQLQLLENVQLGWLSSPITYARIFIPKLLKDVKKCIYLDLDIIVNCDIKELWTIDFVQNKKEYGLCAACADYYEKTNKRLGLSPEHKSFNAGVLLINCNKWREDCTTDKLIKLMKETKLELKNLDQDLLNIYFDGNTKYFDEIFNSAPYFYSKQYISYNPKIYHFLRSRDKPWINIFIHKSDEFWKYMRKTPYYKKQTSAFPISKFVLLIDKILNTIRLNYSTIGKYRIVKLCYKICLKVYEKIK
jgi:lipopolysaccharide biosynthesis glycosyltransferase